MGEVPAADLIQVVAVSSAGPAGPGLGCTSRHKTGYSPSEPPSSQNEEGRFSSACCLRVVLMQALVSLLSRWPSASCPWWMFGTCTPVWLAGGKMQFGLRAHCGDAQ